MPVKVVGPQRTIGEGLFERFGKPVLKFFGYLIVFQLGSTMLGALNQVHDVYNGTAVVGLALACYAFVFYKPVRWLVRRFRPRPDDTTAAEELTPSETGNGAEEPDALYVGDRLDTGARLTLPVEFRARHTYLIGKSGTGKTTLLKRLLIQEMEHGHGVAFIDPHGDAAQDLLSHVPRERVGDVVYFDPTSASCPAFNPLALGFEPAKLQADIISAFKMFFGSSWGDRLEFLLSRSLLTLILDPEPHSFADLQQLVVNDAYREAIVQRTPSAQLKTFWQFEFDGAKASIPALSNKLGQFLPPTSALERLFSQPTNDLDFSRIMNGGKIFIANLAKGQLGEDPSRLLGGLITTAIQQAALARAAIPEVERRPFALYVDEFQNYVVSSFETILSEARKYKLSLTLAHQTISQLSPALYDAITGNVATIVAFAVSADDAQKLRKEMHRSRVVVRIPETPDYLPLADFVAFQKKLLRTARQDRKLGWTNEEYRDFEALGFAQQLKVQNGRIKELERTLETLDRPDLNVAVLRELFSGYEFRDESFPSPDDFLNLPPHHAICRIERAENVFPVRGPLPPAPDPAVRAVIFERQRERASARPAPVVPEPPSAAPPTPKKAEEDFHFRF